MEKKLIISIVIPVYNEEEGLYLLTDKLIEIFQNKTVFNFEIIFIDDCSTDNSLSEIVKLSYKYNNIKYISFSRNFGHQVALKAGLDLAEGHAAISMDADLQHPPELIPLLIEKWREGFDIVITKRMDDPRIGFFKRLSSRLYYRLVNSLSDINIEPGSADFRLLDRKVLDVIKNLQENNLFLRGMVKWIGFKQVAIDYQPGIRTTGQTKYNFSKMMSLAIEGITSFSIKPLRIATWIGIFASSLGFLYGLFALYGYFFTDQNLTGWSSLIVAVVFLGGIQLITLGIIGEYIGKLFMEVKDRPNYIIKESNFEIQE